MAAIAEDEENAAAEAFESNPPPEISRTSSGTVTESLPAFSASTDIASAAVTSDISTVNVPPTLLYTGKTKFLVTYEGRNVQLEITYPRLDLLQSGRGYTDSWPLAQLAKSGFKEIDGVWNHNSLFLSLPLISI